MIYSVRHITKFHYDPPVRESVMEVRMQPRTEPLQRCLSFKLELDPVAHMMNYRDFSGNSVHHFDIAGCHSALTITSRAVVELQERPLPEPSECGTFEDLDALVAKEDHWEMLLPSRFPQSTPLLKALAAQLELSRHGNPLELLMKVNQSIYELFNYTPNSTKVDSPIDDALEARRGVCQDFAHIMIALARDLRIPCRYVSGYLCPSKDQVRSPEVATHAWVEALVPKIGWVAFDPTNNMMGGDRHIRVAIGRDYSDVPPTRGVFKGETRTELSVAVTVTHSDRPATDDPVAFVTRSAAPLPPRRSRRAAEQQQQQ